MRLRLFRPGEVPRDDAVRVTRWLRDLRQQVR